MRYPPTKTVKPRKNPMKRASLSVIATGATGFPSTALRASLLSLSMAVSGAFAATVYSPVVGFLKFVCPAGSDTVVSVPFHPSPRWAGRLLSAPTDQGGGVFRFDLKDSPSFANNELTSSPHLLYCRDASGPEGRHFPIVAHAADSVDVSAAAADLAGLTSDGLVSVIPGWTLDSLLPPASQTALHPSTGPLATERVSELLFFDDATAGTDLAPSRRFYVTASGWFEVGGFADAGSTSIAPGQAFVIRHPAGVAATAFLPSQQVYGGKVALAIPVANGVARDTMLGLPRPVPLTLDQLDFAPGQFVESASTAPGDREDQLLVFDNAATGLNKLPSATYYRSGGQWLRAGTDVASGSVQIEPSAGLLLRKAAGGADAVAYWVNAPTYDVTAP